MITYENNPELFQRLMNAMEGQKRPSYVVLGGKQYRVIWNGKKVVKFIPENQDTMYSSTSVG